MTLLQTDFDINELGECKIASPLRTNYFMDTSKRLLFRNDIDELRAQVRASIDPPAFELAGPRERIYFTPAPSGVGLSRAAASAQA